MIIERVLDRSPCPDLAAHEDRGGGEALRTARSIDRVAVLQTIEDAGLRGRGGAGFPTAQKWRTAMEFSSDEEPTSVVVNAAEGEPGSFKDRLLLRRNPYKVLEGALVAARVLGASEVVVALKASFEYEFDRVSAAIAEMDDAGWFESGSVRIATGPGHYLFGEETALLEVMDGRDPFPRVAPPFRRGTETSDATADVELATEDDSSGEAPVLVNNVETLANVPGIITNGPDWFRELGTAESPGTVVCTISGDTARHGVGELEMGTTLDEAIETIGLGMRRGATALGALSGVANAFVPAARFDTPLTYEDMDGIGSGLGAAGFIVFDSGTDPLGIARGVADFLAVESCGQCEPCKRDGLAVRAELAVDEALDKRVASIEERLATVTDGARCALAQQQQTVIGSVLALLPESATASGPTTSPSARPIVPMVDIVDDRAVLDESQATKNPDWSYGGEDSGQWPAAAGVP